MRVKVKVMLYSCLVSEELGDKVPDSEIEEMIGEADSDGDGKVQFNGVSLYETLCTYCTHFFS